MTKLPDLAPAPNRPPVVPPLAARTLSAKRSAFAAQLEASAPPASLVTAAAASEGDVIGKTLARADIQYTTRVDDKVLELFQDNPFGAPEPQEEANLTAMISQSDLGSPNARLLRLQYSMQRIAQRMMFASNKLKSDGDGNKDIINNVR